MNLELKIPDLELEITIKGGSSRFFGIMLLMENIVHYLRTKELIENPKIAQEKGLLESDEGKP